MTALKGAWYRSLKVSTMYSGDVHASICTIAAFCSVRDFKVKVKSVNINDLNANIGKIEYLEMEMFAYIEWKRCKVSRVQ